MSSAARIVSRWPRSNRASAGITSLCREQTRLAWLLILPPALILLFSHILPLLGLVVISMTNWSGLQPPAFVGASNYAHLPASLEFQAALRNTFVYVAGYVIPNLAIALAIALLLNQKLRGSGFFRSLFFLPIVVSSTSVAVIGLFIFERQFGWLNYLLSLINIPSQGWLQDSNQAMPTIIVINIWQFVGYNVVIFLAGLQAIPEDLYEAATIDGARAWGRFRHVTLPLLAPITFFAFITTCIFAFQVFATIVVLTQGGPGVDSTTTLVYSIYRTAFQYFELGKASSMAVVLFLLVLVFTLVNFRFFGTTSAEDVSG